MINISFLREIFKASEKLSYNLPGLFSESAILSRNILDGLHSARFSGKGDTFWEFREYQKGDPVNSIDWRKTASTKKILVKEKEKEIFKNIYIYFDKTQSMRYKSNSELKSKLFISALFSLTLCRLFSKSREKVYLFNENNFPINCSQNINNFKSDFLFESKSFFPKPIHINSNSLFIIFSDFFYDFRELSKFIEELKKKNTYGYLFQILDPKELTCDFEGYNELQDMETGEKMLLGNDQFFLESYKRNFENMKKSLSKLCETYNWKNFIYYTNANIAITMLDIAKIIIYHKEKVDRII